MSFVGNNGEAYKFIQRRDVETHFFRREHMNTLQAMNPYDNAAARNHLTVSEMISSGMYKIVQFIERAALAT